MMFVVMNGGGPAGQNFGPVGPRPDVGFSGPGRPSLGPSLGAPGPGPGPGPTPGPGPAGPGPKGPEGPFMRGRSGPGPGPGYAPRPGGRPNPGQGGFGPSNQTGGQDQVSYVPCIIPMSQWAQMQSSGAVPLAYVDAEQLQSGEVNLNEISAKLPEMMQEKNLPTAGPWPQAPQAGFDSTCLSMAVKHCCFTPACWFPFNRSPFGFIILSANGFPSSSLGPAFSHSSCLPSPKSREAQGNGANRGSSPGRRFGKGAPRDRRSPERMGSAARRGSRERRSASPQVFGRRNGMLGQQGSPPFFFLPFFPLFFFLLPLISFSCWVFRPALLSTFSWVRCPCGFGLIPRGVGQSTSQAWDSDSLNSPQEPDTYMFNLGWGLEL